MVARSLDYPSLAEPENGSVPRGKRVRARQGSESSFLDFKSGLLPIGRNTTRVWLTGKGGFGLVGLQVIRVATCERFSACDQARFCDDAHGQNFVCFALGCPVSDRHEKTAEIVQSLSRPTSNLCDFVRDSFVFIPFCILVIVSHRKTIVSERKMTAMAHYG